MPRYFIYCRKSTEDDDHQAISLESQVRELTRFAQEHDLFVVEILMESKSARRPGRQVFGLMLKHIARGEADGILAWHPDRLARNAVDGGQIIHLLDTGKIRDMRFPTFTFENSPQGKFMLAIVFGHSKYEVDTLSEHVRRGNRTKREMGWYPGKPPIGYINMRSDTGVKVIGRDPERFSAIQKIFAAFLTGKYTGTELLSLANEHFGLRTRRSWKRAGGPMSQNALYRLLKNPFYTGHIVFQKQWYPANHEPMITLEEFNSVQKLLRGTRTKPHRYRFAYSGLIRCGFCGSAVVAEQKIKLSGKKYVYYHCTHGKPKMLCRQGSIEERYLERQVIDFFRNGNDYALVNQASLRYLLATRTTLITLHDRNIQIIPKLYRFDSSRVVQSLL